MTADGATPEAVVRVERLRFAFPDGTVALRGVSLTVLRGEIVGLLGPNGCGKTTLLRSIARSSAGGDRSVAVAPGASLALATDRPVFRTSLSGRENAVALLRLRGVAADEARARADEALAGFGLGDIADRRVSGYSRGNVQRLELAVAVAARPSCALLDEPLAGLDPGGREDLRGALGALTAAGGSALLSTHDPGFAERVCDRVGFMTDGELAAIDTPAAFLSGISRETRVEIAFADGGAPEAASLGDPPPGCSVIDRTDRGLALRTAEPRAALPGLLGWILDAGARIERLEVREPGLLDAYLAVTGRRLEADSGGEAAA